MTNMTNAITNTVSISMFNRGLAGKVFEDVKKCGAKVVMKNNTAECVLISPDEYVKLIEEVNDARLLALATDRLAHFEKAGIVSEADVLSELGITEEDLVDAGKVVLE